VTQVARDDIRRRIREDPPPETFEWLAGWFGARARVDSWMILEGGGACAIHAVDVVDARGARHPLVLKRFFRQDWVAREPDVAAREARHLEKLVAVDLPIPRLVAVDPDGRSCDWPTVAMTRLPGRVELAADGRSPAERDPWLRALAGPLPILHDIGAEVVADLAPYQSYVRLHELVVPSWSSRPDAWARAIAIVQGPAPAARECFVHRDYHPTNVLFSQGRVSGVLDFTSSSRGAAALDLGHCRLNLAQLHGPEVAERFLALHESLAPASIELDPYWDLLSLLEVVPDSPSVYWGWRNLGVGGLTPELIAGRLDDYVALLVAKRG
jgi:aminoglycoside phosphotransferase (APT) family kinase protein